MSCTIAARSTSSILTPSPRILSTATFYKLSASPPSGTPSLSSSPSRLSISCVRNPLNGGGGDKSRPTKVTKSKRSGRIKIPAAAVAIEDIKTIPDLDRLSEVEFEGEVYSVYCKRGRRGGVMEDRYAAVLGSNTVSKQAFFGVFDGHGGAGAAEFAAPGDMIFVVDENPIPLSPDLD